MNLLLYHGPILIPTKSVLSCVTILSESYKRQVSRIKSRLDRLGSDETIYVMKCITPQITLIDLLDPNVVLHRMFDAGKFDDMFNYCKTLLEGDSSSMLALQNSALSLFHMRRYQDAIDFCNRVLEIQDSDDYALKIKVYSLEGMKRYDLALDCCTLALSSRPDDAWILNSIGLSLNELDCPREAITYYDRALAIDDRDITALVNKAASLYRLKEYEECIRYYDRAHVLDPSMTDVAIAKSRAFAKLGMDDEAFLAAQGMLMQDMEKTKQDAKKNKCTVFHQFCTDEFDQMVKRKPGD